jgi:hypothetical protein
MKLELSRQIFEKLSNVKFHENPSGSSQDVPCGQTGGRTAMTNQQFFFEILRTRLQTLHMWAYLNSPYVLMSQCEADRKFYVVE